MKRFTLHLDKPAYGQACNGCGFCCLHTTCALGQELQADRPGPCPALLPAREGFICGLLTRPRSFPLAATGSLLNATLRQLFSSNLPEAEVSTLLANALGAGLGCDSMTNLEYARSRRKRYRA